MHDPEKRDIAIEFCLLFDTGNQWSYLTERAMKLLELRLTSTQTLYITTFRALQEHTKICPTVTVNICLKDSSIIALLLHVVPTICEPQSCQTVIASVEADDCLMSLDLAVLSVGTSHLPVDILIGCNYYWVLATGSICCSVKDPTAIQTKLG